MNTTLRAAEAAVVAGCLLLAPVPTAQAQPGLEETEQAIKEGTRRIFRALEALMRSIPQYQTPEILDNGDIIIRRKRPDPSEAVPGAPGIPGEDETAT